MKAIAFPLAVIGACALFALGVSIPIFWMLGASGYGGIIGENAALFVVVAALVLLFKKAASGRWW